MQTQDTNKFRKNLSKLPQRDQLAVIDALLAVEAAVTFADIPNLKPLKGYKNYYRTRVGDWRIGLFWTGTSFRFEDVGARGDIYKRYP